MGLAPHAACKLLFRICAKFCAVYGINYIMHIRVVVECYGAKRAGKKDTCVADLPILVATESCMHVSVRPEIPIAGKRLQKFSPKFQHLQRRYLSNVGLL